jgi:hypothetical protein
LRDAASLTDLTQHIAVIDGYKGFNATAAGLGYVSDTAHVFVVNGAQVGFINSTGLNSMAIGQQSPVVGTFSVVQVQSTTGPTWSSGSAAPAATQPVGSIYSRVGGAVGSTLYVSRGGGTWAAVAGV